MTAQAWATVVVGLFAIVGVLVTLRQRTVADDRREWWARFEWALESSYSDIAKKRIDGWRVMAVLVDSDMMTANDERIASSVAGRSSDATQNGRHSVERKLDTSGGVGVRQTWRGSDE